MVKTKKLLFIFTGFFIPSLAFAHVGYVIDKSDVVKNSGTDFKFLFQPLTQGGYLFLILTSLAIILALYFWLANAKWFKKIILNIEHQAKTYTDVYGWMLRLSVGIALIGAGTSGVLISPIMPAGAGTSTLETLAGFFLLAGFLTGPVAILATVLFLFGLFQNFYLLGNLDFLALLLGIIAISDSRPGLEHLLKIPFFPSFKNLKNYAPIIVRVGIGIAMAFLAIYEKILNPHMSAFVIENFHLNNLIAVSPAMWVLSTGIIELFIGLALIFNLKPRLVSAVAFVVLSASFFFFKEAVYSHITLFGALSFIFCTNGGKSNG